MNASFPVSTFISGVSYGFLSKDDIRKLSARRITSAVTLDTLLNPVPGGLYTAELGQFGDNACSTCGLKTPQCPGHCGHIELPVPVYHPTFMDQVLRLLRATCVYCHKLKLSRLEVNKYVCRMRLVEHGLIEELKALDDFDAKLLYKGLSKSSGEEEEADTSEDDDGDDKEAVTTARLNFVNKAIDRTDRSHSSEAVKAARRIVVSEFLSVITKPSKCHNCTGISHKYRKDRFTKIFRKPLTKEQRNKMIQANLSIKDPVVDLAKRKRKGYDTQSRKRARLEDEGIADMDRSSDEESNVEIAGGDDDEAAEVQVNEVTQELYLNPSRVLAQLNELFIMEQPVLSLLYGKRPGQLDLTADMFFIHDVLVPPNRYRPEARQGKDEISEAQENTLYKNIITAAENLNIIQRELKDPSQATNTRYRARTYVDFENAWVVLQDAVNSMIDKDRNPVTGAAAKRVPDGVKQKLEKKEGLFRKNMMGKRVNFAARTVISPDPNIETNEIGVPPVFAVKLTYPEPVTIHNLEELQEAVRNGPHLWPGATAIENENGQIISLERKNAEERTALANQLLATSQKGNRPKKVLRHLNNGDIVIMNRQPTLHKPSMMCHRARVLPGEKTLRMHYANCNTYNADFDGDEMNMHFPQNEIARAEALSIADTDHQYLSATAGSPLRGLIQDHISICVILTSRDSFFTKGDYMQLLYAALRPENGHCTSGRLETVPPAILKPRPLWTGKQVISSVMKNVTPQGTTGLTMTGKSKTDAKFWGSKDSEEATVIFQEGELLSGILDKKQIGPADGGFVHSVYEIYGHTVAGRLLSVLGRLLTKMLHMRAHSCGVADLIFTKEGEINRREALKASISIGADTASKYVSLDEYTTEQEPELKRRLEDILRDDDKQKGLDNRMKAALAPISSAVTAACLPSGLVKPFPRNQMQLMTGSGAKGTEVNANQISCNLGQQVLEGRRVPVMISGKTLPCFKPFEPSARAGGYIVDRFLTGVRPQEFFFHAMAGREGLIDTAVKTSRSGYLQRCLIKGMEGLKVQHDTTVRDSDGSVIQFLYGEDGLDVAKSNSLSNFTFAAQNYLSLTQALAMNNQWDRVINSEAKEAVKSAEKRYRKTHDLAASDPGISKYNPAQNGGAISERMLSTLREYMDKNPDSLLKDKEKGRNSILKRSTFQSITELRYLRALVEAGEAVGVVAGQSVGEPSTQMTLNTFHLAGHSTKNVTLGIPRLRELVMTAAANIATPLMTIRLADVSVETAKAFAKGISRLALSELLDKVTIREKIGSGRAYTSAKMYQVKLEFFPRAEVEREYGSTPDEIFAALESRFLPRLQASIRKEMSKRREDKTLKGKSDARPEIGKSAGAIEQHTGRAEADREDGADDSDVDDGDATGAKSRANQRQEGYDDLEDDEERNIAANARDKDDSDDEEIPQDEAYHSQESESSDSEAEDTRTKQRVVLEELEERIRSNKTTSDVVSFKIDANAEACSFTLEYAAETAKVLMLQLVEKAARAALVQTVPGISSADYESQASEDAGVPIVVTEGSNIRAMWDNQHIISPDYLYTNNVHEVLQNYGVEAARATITRELSGVFGGHGISVDNRHLTLIADFMTRDGGYTPFNRNGYRSNASPFMKMSFETTVGFLRDAVLDGDSDDLTNPSARIVVGRMNNVGTGGFDVLLDLDTKRRELPDSEPSMAV